MKKNLLLLTLFGCLIYLVASAHIIGPAAVVNRDCTGVTSGTSGCGGPSCHGTSPSAYITDTIIVLNATGVPVNYYVPGEFYTIRIRGFNNSTSILPKFGYQLTAVKTGTSISLGSLLPTSNIHNIFVTGTLCVSEQSHTLWCSGGGGFGSSYQTDVQWICPWAGSDSVTLSVVTCAVDTNGTAGPEDLWNAPAKVVLAEGPPPTIFGPLKVCKGFSTPLSHTPTGGTWTTSDPSIAVVNPVTATLTGLSAGTILLSYTTPTGTTGVTFTVNPLPAVPTGIYTVCPGGTSTLTDSTPGGVWSSSNVAKAVVGASSGSVSGVTGASGGVLISYQVLSTGCIKSVPFTVATGASVTGTSAMCAGASSPFTHPFAGGSWYSSNTTVATVGASGIVTGVSGGTSIISYNLSTTACDAQKIITINSAVPKISGASTVCRGYAITLAATPTGGTWTSSDATIASVGPGGLVTGASTGSAIVKYIATSTCGTDSTEFPVTVSTASPCVTGVADPFAQTNDIRLYPNPNRGSFAVNVLSVLDEEVHIVITNIVGAKIRELSIKTNEENNISINQPPGIYFLTATTPGSKYTVKIVVE